MPPVRAPKRAIWLFHWRASEAEALIRALNEAGFRVLYNEQTQSPSVREIQEAGTQAIVIDLSRLPSHGRYVGAWVRGSKGTRHLPLIFAGGEAEKVAAIRKEIPDAAYVPHAGLIATLKTVKAPENPVIPKQMMQTDPARTTAQKLGMRTGLRVGVIDPPGDYERVIGTLPEDIALEGRTRGRVLYDAVVRARSGKISIRASVATRSGIEGALVDPVAKRKARRVQRQFRSRSGAGGGLGGLQDLLAGRGLERDAFHRKETENSFITALHAVGSWNPHWTLRNPRFPGRGPAGRFFKRAKL